MIMKLLGWFAALFGAFLVAFSSAAEPPEGFQAVLSQSAFTELDTVVIPILVKALQGLTVPDISGSAGTPVGSIDYTLSDIKMTSVSIGSSSIQLSPGKIAVSLDNMNVALSADW